MERPKYISLATELRQIAARRAFTLLDNKEDAQDVAGEVLLRLWEKHRDLRDNDNEVRHLADIMARNLSLDLLRRRRRHPTFPIPANPSKSQPSQPSQPLNPLNPLNLSTLSTSQPSQPLNLSTHQPTTLQLEENP
ncbi:MAG: hypothetical protein IJV36_05315 [Prevotella sp.]|nr:hypothetical protein [Prevotella sp.]